MSRNINLSISEEKLAKLMLAGELCAADVKCLDRESKTAIWRLCLWCCRKRSSCQHCQNPCGLNKQQSLLDEWPMPIELKSASADD